MSSSTRRKVVRLSGELELNRRDEIAAALRVDGSESSILVDLYDVTYADSSALSELLRFRTQADAQQVPVALVIGSKQFARLIQYAGLAHAFKIFEDRGQALSYLSGAETQ